MITIIDYGVGNLFSLSSSLNYLGLENKVSRDPEDLKNCCMYVLNYFLILLSLALP